MAAIGASWVDGAWIEAGWVTGAWAGVLTVAFTAAGPEHTVVLRPEAVEAVFAAENVTVTLPVENVTTIIRPLKT